MIKPKSKKRALLMSVLALLMCVSMLIGSTFAWFTDAVTSGSNVITAGNLDIEVEYTIGEKENGEYVWKNLNGAADLFQKGLWEPGHTEVVALRVKNAGTLACKFQVALNLFNETIGKTEEGKDIKLSDILMVSTASFDELEASSPAFGGSGWLDPNFDNSVFNHEDQSCYNANAEPQTFSEALAGLRFYVDADKWALGDTIEADNETRYIVIKVDMPEAVGNEANHDGRNIPTIAFGVNVLATQYTYEKDSFGDQYDADAPHDAPLSDGIWVVHNGVNTQAASLSEAYALAATGDRIYIAGAITPLEGITISGKSIEIIGKNAEIDTSKLNGSLFTVAAGASLNLHNLRIVGGAKGFSVDYDAVTFTTNYNIPLKAGSGDGDVKRAAPVIVSNGNLTGESVTIQDHYSTGNGAAITISGGSAVFSNSDFIHNYSVGGGAVYVGASIVSANAFPINSVRFVNCTFEDNYAAKNGGGAVYMVNTEVAEFTDCKFNKNSCSGSSGYGGAILVQTDKAEKNGLDYTQVTVDGCTFGDNWAGNDGFAIQNYDAEFTITDSVFKKNVGVHSGSSVATFSCHVYRGNAFDFAVQTITDCLFEANKGPASCISEHGCRVSFVVNDTEFKDNEGDETVLFYTGVATFENCKFVGDKSTKATLYFSCDEGGYYVGSGFNAGNVTLTDCIFEADVNQEYSNIYVVDGWPGAAKATLNLKGNTKGSIMLTDGHYVHLYGTHTGTITTDAAENIIKDDGAQLDGEIINNSHFITPNSLRGVRRYKVVQPLID